MNIPLLNLKRQYAYLKADIEKVISNILESGAYINGPYTKELETKLAKYLDVKHVIGVANGTDALVIALKALGIKEGDEVITTPFSFSSTTHAIVRNGLTPVFCDINSEDYTIDVTKIESLITEKTCAIVPVHVYGNLCNVEEIERIAKKQNLKVIYDAAHTFGVEKNGKGVGSFGDASMFSFHATKVYNTIEGGAVTYGDISLKKKLNDLKNFGITGSESVEYIGGNAKMNEFQAAMGICNLRHVDDEILKRKAVVERYRNNLGNIEGIKLSSTQEGVKSNYAYFPVVFDNYKYTRDEVFEKLEKENIIARKYFYPLINDYECYRDKYNSQDTPVAKYISDRILCLPIYADLELEIVDKICKIIEV